MAEEKYNKTDFIGGITLKEMKENRLPFPDKFGDNAELKRFIAKKYNVKIGEFRIKYVADDKDLEVYKNEK